jgi:hypothetical protein
VVPRWDRPLDHPESPYRQSLDAKDLPLPRTGPPIESELGIWLYIARGLVIFLVGGLLLSNAMYGLFELLDLLAG